MNNPHGGHKAPADPAPPASPVRVEQLEYERLTVELEPILQGLAGGISPLLPPGQGGLVLFAALVHQAARTAAAIGLSQVDFEKRVAVLAGKVYAPRVAIPKIVL